MESNLRHIRPATAADMLFIKSLQKRYTNQLGFLPTAALAEYIKSGRILLNDVNGQEAGYVLWRPAAAGNYTGISIIQAAVCQDAQRLHVGRGMIDHLRSTHTVGVLGCWCATDLEANSFWQALGFLPCASRLGGKRRARHLTLYRRSEMPGLDVQRLDLPARAGWKAKKLVGPFLPRPHQPRGVVEPPNPQPPPDRG